MHASRPSYFRALLTVTICYGLALAEDYLDGGAIFRVSATDVSMPIVGWPMFFALWLMTMVHMPLVVYYWIDNIQVNSYFSNESVFKAVFSAWYGGIALMGFLAMVSGMQYGWLLIMSMLFAAIGLARRGIRLRQIADYGSTCASLFVFYMVSDEVPPKLWWSFYLGIGIVQCAFLAFLEMVFAKAFSTAEIPAGDTTVSLAPPVSLVTPREVLDEPPTASSPTTAESLKDMSAG